DGAEPGREGLVRGRIDRPVADLRAGRVGAEVLPGPALLRRADRSRHEAAAAVRADVVEDPLHAVGAVGAFEAADARLGPAGREGATTVFTDRSKLEHGSRLRSRTRCHKDEDPTFSDSYSGSASPVPPISFGRSASLGRPSFMRSTVAL